MTHSNEGPLIEAESVSAKYGRRRAVTDVSVRVLRGRCTALVGPNGSGKTTLLRILAGLHPPYNGCVSYDGRPLKTWSPVDRATFRSLLIQRDDVAFDFTGAEIIALGLTGADTASSPSHPNVRTVLQDLSALHLADRPWSQMSGGERQRIQICRCLVSKPPVHLFDEPLNHVDLATKLRFRDVVHAECARGAGVVVSTHDLDLAASADNVLLLRDGHVIGRGRPANALTPDAIREAFDLDANAAPQPDPLSHTRPVTGTGHLPRPSEESLS